MPPPLGSTCCHDASRARSSEPRNARPRAEIMIGGGRMPAFTQRQIVIRLLSYRRQAPDMLRNHSPSPPLAGEGVASCDMPPI